VLTDGDPRTLTPDFYGRMTRLERRLTVNAFERRLALQGRGSARFPDDQLPAAVAQRALTVGTATAFWMLGAAVGGIVTLVFALTVPGADLPMNNGFLYLTYFGTLGLVLCMWRMVRGRQIRRFFATFDSPGPPQTGAPQTGSEHPDGMS
jgi:hypothetical protein